MAIRKGDIVRIIPEFFLQYMPMPIGVVEEKAILGQGHWQLKVGFPLHDTKFWVTDIDVEVMGHVEHG